MQPKKVLSAVLPSSVKTFLKKAIRRSEDLTDQSAKFRRISSLKSKDFEFWEKNGYLVLPRFFNSKRIEKISDLIDQTWKDRANKPENFLVIDAFIGTEREQRVLLKDAPDEARNFPYKLNDLFLEFQEVRDLILDKKLAKILHDLLEGDPMACNSLSFERGSQQPAHFDTFYMPPLVPNKMLATWIALEDCSLDAGPLIYYPGSHKLKPYCFSHGGLHAVREEMPQCQRYIQAELEKHDLRPQKFAARAGDVFIWHAQLLHGGSEINNLKLTRKSIVTHYFRAQEHPGSYITMGKYRHYQNRYHQMPTSS